MRLKLSPRQKVVSLALAVLALGVLAILAFRYYGNIFADTATAKTKVTISLTNWSEGEQATYFKYVDDKQYRCSTIDIYLQNAQKGYTPQELVANNKQAIIVAIPEILNATNEKYKLIKDSENKFIQASSVIDAVKTTEGWQGIPDREVGEKIKRLVVQNSTGYQCQGIGSVAYDKTFIIPAKYQDGDMTATTKKLLDSSSDIDDTASDESSATDKKVCLVGTGSAMGKTGLYTGSDGKNFYLSEHNGRELPGSVIKSGNNYTGNLDSNGAEETYNATKNEDCNNLTQTSTQPTTSTGDTQTQNLLKVGVTVENANGTPVKDALVSFYSFKTSSSEDVSSDQDKTTDENGYVQVEVDKKTDPYLEITAEKKGEVAKIERFKISSYPLPGLSSHETAITIDITDEQAQTSEDHANTAATAGNPQQELVAPVTGVSYDANWPGGDNTLILSAQRRSLHLTKGYTPVGGVSFDITVYALATQKTSLNIPYFAEIANAQTGGIRGSAADDLRKSFASSTTPQLNVTNPPYDTEQILPYQSNMSSEISSWSRNNRLSKYTVSGTIPDNGANSRIILKNMPDGLYDVRLSKTGFKNSRFIINQDEAQDATCDAPLTIGASRGAEPPSISTALIYKTPNANLYTAGDYVYYPQYPWYGWQKKDGYITDEPQMVQGVPGVFNTSGGLIGGTATSPEMQQCIKDKLKSVSVSAKNLSFKDILLGAGGAYLLKQSEKQNQDWANGAMKAVGIASLVKLAKESDARFNINYDEINCAEQIYGTNGGIATGCEGCLKTLVGQQGTCNPLCFLQYGSMLSGLSGISTGALFNINI